ncbi:hypothetical protein E4P42_20985 [Mycobacterium sp. PS03-16]|uniref:hypothetical protein n=1 Tax=Mycobacterium sp. PS03-16 TaxID=2559611 RepID=UPI001073F642|nr:hypothetical protein [Mycobacterium sp. PS03-16]TFV55938.1 hypothetical protein E4P42_20985 [Mycobacterium sp. PS03-16]
MTIGGELARARQLAFAGEEAAARDLLLALVPSIERADRDDHMLEVLAQLGDIYLARGADDGAAECIRRIDDCVAVYADILGGGTPPAPVTLPPEVLAPMVRHYTQRARFLEIGRAAGAGDHERAAALLAALARDDGDAVLLTRARILCATALEEDDLYARAAPLWEQVLAGVDDPGNDADWADHLLVTAGLGYGRFCVATGRLDEAQPWLRRADARADTRGWPLSSARAALERAAAAWAAGDHETTERLLAEAQPVLNRYARADDVARCWMYLGLIRMAVGELAAADECWAHAERHWRELAKPLRLHRILLQRSWIPIFRGHYAEAAAMVGHARAQLDASPRSSWLQYARLDDHLGTVWRADALADLGFDAAGDPDDTLAEVEEKHVASLGVTRADPGADRHRSAMHKLKQAADLKVPAALAVDAVRYALADSRARMRWATAVSAPILAGAFAVAWEGEDTALLGELIEYHRARGAFSEAATAGGGGGLPDTAAATVPLDDPDDLALVAAGPAAPAAAALTRLGPLPPLQMDPGAGPVLDRYRQLAADRYGRTVTSDEPGWSTWP